MAVGGPVRVTVGLGVRACVPLLGALCLVLPTAYLGYRLRPSPPSLPERSWMGGLPFPTKEEGCAYAREHGCQDWTPKCQDCWARVDNTDPVRLPAGVWRVGRGVWRRCGMAAAGVWWCARRPLFRPPTPTTRREVALWWKGPRCVCTGA